MKMCDQKVFISKMCCGHQSDILFKLKIMEHFEMKNKIILYFIKSLKLINLIAIILLYY